MNLQDELKHRKKYGYQEVKCDVCNKKSIYISKICSDCLRASWERERKELEKPSDGRENEDHNWLV